ncbi:MAG: hypothetical protein AAFV59_10960 [Pseudomonadota bacterium]
MKPLASILIAAAFIGAGITHSDAAAQSAPGLSERTFISGQQMRASRSEAVSTAAYAEKREQSLAFQRAQLSLLEAEARAALQPRMELRTGGSSPVYFSMPAGNGLLPGTGGGENNYHVNIQVGEGNSSVINTNTLSTSEVISDEDETDSSENVE